MQTPSLHIEALDPKDAGFVRMLKGVSELMSGVQEQYTRCATEKQEFQLQLQEQQLEATNIVAEGKQKKLVAILNAIFEGGYITGCSKKEFMQRASVALGCPGIADYTKTLYNVKNTYQYDDIFTELGQVAHNELTKND